MMVFATAAGIKEGELRRLDARPFVHRSDDIAGAAHMSPKYQERRFDQSYARKKSFSYRCLLCMTWVRGTITHAPQHQQGAG